MLNDNKDSSNVIIDILDDDGDYLFEDFNIDGKILINRESVDNLINENNELRQEINQLRAFTNVKTNNKYSLKKLFLECLDCFNC